MEHVDRTNGDDLASARNALREKTTEIGKELKGISGLVKDAAKETLEDVKTHGSESIETVKHTMQEQSAQLMKYVKAHPVKSLLIGLGAGMAIGYIARK